jgi:hypothetical protein
MKKSLLSLFVAITLLLAPIAHAFDLNCESDKCQMSEQNEKEPKSEKQQDNDKMANGGHHCCCPHGAANITADLSAPETASSQAVFPTEDVSLRSVVQGPPLKPPSRA